MKPLIVFFSFIIFLFICIAGCRKERSSFHAANKDNKPENAKGVLVFKIKKDNNSPLKNREIHIYYQAEGSADYAISSKRTGDDGKADFGKLDTGKYYYSVKLFVDNIPHQAEGVVEVKPGQVSEQVLRVSR